MQTTYRRQLLVLLFSCALCAAGSALAQKPAKLTGQPLIDSLLKELATQKEDTNKVNLLNHLSGIYYAINPDEGVKYGQHGLELASKLAWKKGMANTNNNLGVNYMFKSDYPKALIYFNASLKISEETEDRAGIAKAIADIGLVYDHQGEYAKALEYLLKALKIHEEVGDKAGVANNTGNIGIVYQEQGDYPRTLEYDLKALKLYEELGDKFGVTLNTGNIGNVYASQEDYPKALEYFSKAVKMAEEIGNKHGVSVFTGNIGNVYNDGLKDYPKALEYYFKDLKIAEEIGDKDGVAIVTVNIGNVYRRQHHYSDAATYLFKALRMDEESGDKYSEAVALGYIADDYVNIVTDTAGYMLAGAADSLPTGQAGLIPKGRNPLLRKAVEYYEKAAAVNKEINSLDNLQLACKGLATADSLLGDYKGALIAKSLFIVYKDSVFSKENDKKILAQQMKYEYDKKETIARAEQDKKDFIQRNIRNSTLAGMAGLLIFSVIVYRQRNKVKKEKRRSDELLLNILPHEVAEELKEKGSAEAKLIDEVTVLFTDFKDFTLLSELLSPTALVAGVNECFSAFDHIMQKHGVEKIKTIGDSYMAAGGLPVPNKTNSYDAVQAAMEIQQYMREHKSRKEAAHAPVFEIRIGIHTGPVVAGIVGVKKFAYDIWGDTVNTAARMEQNCETGKINISQVTYELVKEKFTCEYRGEIDAKNKGALKMYYVKPLTPKGEPLI